MATCLGWFATLGVHSTRLAAELLASTPSAKKEDVPSSFRLFEQNGQSTGWGPWKKTKVEWTLSFLEGEGGQYSAPAHASAEWAQAVSLRMNVVTVSFFLLEGGWSYSVFEGGKEIAAQEHYTLPQPEVYGDIEHAARILGVEASLFRVYEQALQEENEEPLPGDEFAATDEWMHTDFARRLGIIYPDDYDSGKTLNLPPVEREKCGKAWSGLPERLQAPDSHAETTGESREIDFDNFPSGDDPF